MAAPLAINRVAQLAAIAAKPKKTIIGLNSGTSVDGIDAALVTITGSGFETKVEELIYICEAYHPELRERVLAASRPGAGSVDEICRLNVAVGECLAAAALKLAETAGLEPAQIDLIGSHGQTLHHLPEAEPLAGVNSRGTLQIGEPALIAKRTGIITIADFRPGDVALGGQGAPLVPLMDYLIFRSEREDRAALNLGGIANLTLLRRGCRLDELIAFDTGPGNMLIDGLARRLFGRKYDDDGLLAAAGDASPELLQRLLAHPYYQRPIPKSTGREEFGEDYLQNVLQWSGELQLSHDDILATVTELTAVTVANALHSWNERDRDLSEVIVSGGGAHNDTLMRSLSRHLQPARVVTCDKYGVSIDAKEAVLFAILANETIAGNAGNVRRVTGAQQATILGKICL